MTTARQIQAIEAIEKCQRDKQPCTAWNIGKYMPPDFSPTNIYKVLKTAEKAGLITRNDKSEYNINVKEMNTVGYYLPESIYDPKFLRRRSNLVRTLAMNLKTQPETTLLEMSSQFKQVLDLEQVMNTFLETLLILQVIQAHRGIFDTMQEVFTADPELAQQEIMRFAK